MAETLKLLRFFNSVFLQYFKYSYSQLLKESFTWEKFEKKFRRLATKVSKIQRKSFLVNPFTKIEQAM